MVSRHSPSDHFFEIAGTLTEVVINSSVNTDIRFHSTGNWYDEEFKDWHFENNTEANACVVSRHSPSDHFFEIAGTLTSVI